MVSPVRVVMLVVMLASGLARAGAPTLSISELPSGATKTFTEPRPDTWTHTFFVYATTDGSVTLAELKSRVQVQAFQSNHAPVALVDPVPALVAIDGASTVLDREHPAKFTMSAKFVEPDTYTTSLFIFVPGQTPFVRDLTVQVGASTTTPTITLKQVDTKEFSTAAGSDTTVTLSVQNESDTEQVVGVSPGRFTHKAAGEPEVDAGVSPKTPDQLTVAARATKTIAIALGALDAGEYDGHIRLTAPGATPIVLDAKIYSKSGIVVAALFIALGVIIGWFVAWVRDRWGSRQNLKIGLGRARDQLQGIARTVTGDAMRAALDDLLEEGRKTDEDIWLGKADANTINNYAERVALFRDANRVDRAISELSLGGRRDKRKALSDVLAILVQPGTTEIANARKLLAAIDTNTARRLELDGAVEAIVASVAEYAITTDAQLKADLDTQVNLEIKSARDAQRDGRLEDMAAAIERARTALAAAGTESMLRYVGIRPAWADQARFKQFADELRAMPAKTPDDYLALRQKFIEGLIAITKQAATKAAIPTTELDAAVAGNAGVMAALEALHAKLAAAGPEGAMMDGLPADAHLVGVGSVASAPELPAVESSAPRRDSERVPWQKLYGRKRAIEALITGVTLLLAVAAGLKVLWFGSASWGSGNDFINAVLWGTGVKVAADTFLGLESMRASIAKG